MGDFEMRIEVKDIWCVRKLKKALKPLESLQNLQVLVRWGPPNELLIQCLWKNDDEEEIVSGAFKFDSNHCANNIIACRGTFAFTIQWQTMYWLLDLVKYQGTLTFVPRVADRKSSEGYEEGYIDVGYYPKEGPHKGKEGKFKEIISLPPDDRFKFIDPSLIHTEQVLVRIKSDSFWEICQMFSEKEKVFINVCGWHGNGRAVYVYSNDKRIPIKRNQSDDDPVTVCNPDTSVVRYGVVEISGLLVPGYSTMAFRSSVKTALEQACELSGSVYLRRTDTGETLLTFPINAIGNLTFYVSTKSREDPHV